MASRYTSENRLSRHRNARYPLIGLREAKKTPGNYNSRATIDPRSISQPLADETAGTSRRIRAESLLTRRSERGTTGEGKKGDAGGEGTKRADQKAKHRVSGNNDGCRVTPWRSAESHGVSRPNGKANKRILALRGIIVVIFRVFSAFPPFFLPTPDSAGSLPICGNVRDALAHPRRRIARGKPRWSHGRSSARRLARERVLATSIKQAL